MGFGLDDWIYCTFNIHTVWDYRQLQRYLFYTLSVHRYTRTKFSVFTSHILVTDLSQPNSFLAIILQLPIPKTLLNSTPGRLASRSSTLRFLLDYSDSATWLLLARGSESKSHYD
jgi:hypothetical protein